MKVSENEPEETKRREQQQNPGCKGSGICGQWIEGPVSDIMNRARGRTRCVTGMTQKEITDEAFSDL